MHHRLSLIDNALLLHRSWCIEGDGQCSTETQVTIGAWRGQAPNQEQLMNESEVHNIRYLSCIDLMIFRDLVPFLYTASL